MKKTVLLMLLILVLAGCSRPAWETVDDMPAEVPAASWLDEVYTIQTDLPQDMELIGETDGWRLYSNQDGTMEVETRVFPASDLTSAVKLLTGYEQEQLNILQTQRFDLPEYQFVWVTQTECGQRLSRADLVVDGTECYAVVCSTLESAGNDHSDEMRQVLSTFGLYLDEGV